MRGERKDGFEGESRPFATRDEYYNLDVLLFLTLPRK